MPTGGPGKRKTALGEAQGPRGAYTRPEPGQGSISSPQDEAARWRQRAQRRNPESSGWWPRAGGGCYLRVRKSRHQGGTRPSPRSPACPPGWTQRGSLSSERGTRHVPPPGTHPCRLRPRNADFHEVQTQMPTSPSLRAIFFSPKCQWHLHLTWSPPHTLTEGNGQ